MKQLATWQSRARLGAALSEMYGAEVPAYTTLVAVVAEVNREYAAGRPDAERLGSVDRVSSERHGAIRVATPRDDEMASLGLAYYRGGDPSKPVVYEDFLPASAAGIFRSNLDVDTQAAEAVDDSDYGLDWMAGQIGHHIHDPYELSQKAELQ